MTEPEFTSAEGEKRSATVALEPSIVNTQINNYPIYGITYRTVAKVYQSLLDQESESIGKTFAIRKFFEYCRFALDIGKIPNLNKDYNKITNKLVQMCMVI